MNDPVPASVPVPSATPPTGSNSLASDVRATRFGWRSAGTGGDRRDGWWGFDGHSGPDPHSSPPSHFRFWLAPMVTGEGPTSPCGGGRDGNGSSGGESAARRDPVVSTGDRRTGARSTTAQTTFTEVCALLTTRQATGYTSTSIEEVDRGLDRTTNPDKARAGSASIPPPPPPPPRFSTRARLERDPAPVDHILCGLPPGPRGNASRPRSAVPSGWHLPSGSRRSVRATLRP